MTDLRQKHFRFRTDAGTADGTPTWGAGEDVDYYPGSANFRLRVGLQNALTNVAATAWEIYVSKNGDAFTPVTTTIAKGVQSVDAGSSADDTSILIPRLTPFGSGWWLADSSIDLWFENGEYYDSAITSYKPVLLLHMDGADASTTFTDTMGRHTMTVNGNAQIDTAQSKFGGASGLFDGTGDYLVTDSSSDFSFGTGDFTIDFWFRIAASISSNQTLVADTEFALYQIAGQLRFYANGSDRLTDATTLVVDTWYHAALVRSAGVTRMYLNGVSGGGTYSDTTNYTFTQLYMGANSAPGNYLNGWLDELRVIKGYAAWQTNFTPPTAAYSNPFLPDIDATNYVSCSRASTGYAKTSLDTLTSFATNTLRITDRGLLIEDTRTNVVLWDRDLTNAAWTKVNMTAAKDQTGPDGVSNSASSLLATAGNATALQAITLASSARFQTAWVKRLIGSGTINMTMDNGATWTAITVTSSWSRLSIPTQTLANPTVGFRIVTSGDQIAVDFVQNEDGAFASSEIETTTVATTRATDNITVTGNLDTLLTANTASVVVDHITNVTPSLLNGNAGIFWDTSSSTGLEIGSNETSGLMFDTGAAHLLGFTLAGAFSSGAKIGVCWNPSGRSGVGGGGTVATDAFGSMGSANYGIGVNVSSLRTFAYFRRLTAWNTRLADATLQGFTAP